MVSRTAVQSLATMKDPMLWNDVFAEELTTEFGYAALCSGFDLIKAILAVKSAGPGDLIHRFNCVSEPYEHIAQIITELIQSNDWDEFLEVGSDDASKQELARVVERVFQIGDRAGNMSFMPIHYALLSGFNSMLATLE